MGDQVVSIGGLSLPEYRSGWNSYLFQGRRPDGSIQVVVQRGDALHDFVLPASEENAGTSLIAWGIPIIFWVVGTAVALFVRPTNASWLTLLVLCWSTAVWFSAGLGTYYRTPWSALIFHGIVWFFLPLLIHTHLVVPYPILNRWHKKVLPLIYVAAAAMASLDLLHKLPKDTNVVWAAIAVATTSILLVLRLTRSSSPAKRVVDRILFVGVVVGFVPLAVMILLRLVPMAADARQALSSVSAYLLLAILPIWPLSYLYALFKYSSGPMEVRANRLLGTYAFLCLFVTCFLALYGLGDLWLANDESKGLLALALSLVFVLVAPPLRQSFQRLIDRTVYGIDYLPEEIIGVFAARIPRAFDVENLKRILMEEVTPALMIRESALYVWGEEHEVEDVYRSGDGGTLAEVPQGVLMGWRDLDSPTEPLANEAAPDWIRLAVPLHGREQTVGVWLLGRRDPDDLYPKSDRELLHNIANQIAPVVENVRLVERARQEVEENRRLQQQLIQSQKMEAIGRLSAGVAHDFNNLLSVILGYCSLLAVKYRGDETLTSYLDDIRDAGDRAAALTRQLLAFSRQQVMEPKTVRLNDVVRDVERMLQRLTGEDVEVIIQLADDLPRVRIDSAQMGQVVMNLAVNARDAMPAGGTFRLRTEFLQLDEPLESPIQGEIPSGDYVLLAVTDSGIGMPADQLHRIFEPYFTTKELGKGTGLGLSMVYGIVSQFKGYIRVESREGSGTTFSIYLPALLFGEESAVGVHSPYAGEEQARGSETILLVEDEDSVRHVASEILESRGYRVISAADGIQALQAFDVLEQRLDLLLTDVIMPQMKGTDLAEQLCRKQPDLPVLFMSGYNEEAVFSGWRGDPGQRPPLISKPFSPASLVIEIRRLLDQSEATRKVATLGERPA